MLYFNSLTCLILIFFLFGLEAKVAYNRILKSRKDLGKYLQLMGTDFNVGVEIGVQNGIFSKRILDSWTNNKKFYLVDVWAPLKNYTDPANVPVEMQNECFLRTKARLSDFQEKTTFLKTFSANAAKIFRDQGVRFDFVYIDARHDYCSVKEDINLYYNLLKEGGIISGHDYFNHAKGYDTCPNGTKIEGAVQRAVDEFANLNGVVVNVLRDSWLIFKP